MIIPQKQLIGAIAEKQSNRATYMYSKGIESVGLKFIYNGYAFEKADLPAAVQALTNLSSGFTVSMPFKQEIIKYLDEPTNEVAQIGACNTVEVINGKKLKGHNTDGKGAIIALKEETILKDAQVLLIGAGGTAKAIAYELHQEEARVTIANRTLQKAKDLAQKYGFTAISLDDISWKDYASCINATSVCPVIPEFSDQVFLDVDFFNLETDFLKGATTKITGLDMLIYQCIEQFRILFKKAPSFETLRDAYLSFEPSA